MANKLWDDVRKSLQDLGNLAAEKGKVFSKAAADKAEELTRTGKIKLDVLQVNREIDHLFSKLGGKAYQLHVENNLEGLSEDAEAATLFEKIATLEKKKVTLEEKLKTLSREQPETKAEGAPADASGESGDTPADEQEDKVEENPEA